MPLEIAEDAVRADVQVSRKLPQPIAQEPLTDEKLRLCIVDPINRIVQIEYAITSADGSVSTSKTVILQDGVSSIGAPKSADQKIETPNGFESVAAAVKAFLTDVQAARIANGLD